MEKRGKILIILAIILAIIVLIFVYFQFFRQNNGAKAALTELQLTELPAKVAKETGLDITVTAYEGGSVMTDYTGTIHFSSTDPAVTLPNDYTFELGDEGVKTFDLGLYFGSPGTYDLTVEDESALISDTQSGIVVFDGHSNGSLVQVSGSPTVYYLQDGQRSIIPSVSVFESQFFWNQIVTVSSTEINNYTDHSTEPTMHYREGTLFRLSSSPTAYVVEDKKKRVIDSASTFTNKGYSWSSIRIAESQSVVDLHETGDILTDVSNHPEGTLIRASSNPTVYVIDNSERRTIPSRTVFESQFKWGEVCLVSEEVVNSYPLGSNWQYRNGSIVKDYGVPNIYYIEDTFKRTFTSGMFYTGLGYSWNDYQQAESGILDSYAAGRDMYQLAKYIDILGDTQRSTSVLQALTSQITQDLPYLVMHVGDVVDDCTASGWVTFHQVSDYILSNTRYYAILGNNDVSCSQFDAQFGTNYYSSFDTDNIHYIILNSNTSLASGSAQYNWLSNDLTNQPAETQFTLVFFHHPPYTAGGLADAIALFEANGVDAVFNGHVHLYARKISNGIYYFILGGGAYPVSSCPAGDYTTCVSSNHHAKALLNNGQLEIRVYNLNETLIDSVDITGV